MIELMQHAMCRRGAGRLRRRGNPLRLVLCVVVCATSAAGAMAQSYPVRAIRLIVPTSPGGGVDFMARLMGSKLAENTGQPVVIDNRAGGGNAMGTEIAARAAPDGYTLTMGNNSSHGVNPAFNPKLPYDSIRDFSPITVIASAPLLLVTSNAVPSKSVREFVELAKAKPGQFNFASAGSGTQTHLSGELFKFATGTNLVHVPYKGVGPAFNAILGGEVHLLFASVAGAMVHVQAGRLKAVGITGVKRSQLLPEMPTLTEQGVAGFETGTWYAMLGPGGMARPIVARLNRELLAIINTADFRQKMATLGAEPVGSTPEECAEVIKSELARWTTLIKQTGIRID